MSSVAEMHATQISVQRSKHYYQFQNPFGIRSYNKLWHKGSKKKLVGFGDNYNVTFLHGSFGDYR